MTTKLYQASDLQSKNVGNHIQTYKTNPLAVTKSQDDQIQYPLPDFDALVQINETSKQIQLEERNLEQRRLQLESTKKQYKQKLLDETKDIQSRVITIEKRKNIAQLVDQIRKHELELQNKVKERMDQYKPTQKLDKSQKNNLFIALINKVTDVN